MAALEWALFTSSGDLARFGLSSSPRPAAFRFLSRSISRIFSLDAFSPEAWLVFFDVFALPFDRTLAV
jgi:hypothetical protein